MIAERPGLDAASLEVLRHALVAVAEEMNANLVRTAFSPNIKERRDCSSALFTVGGAMVAQAASIPVHLGAMPFAVRYALSVYPALEEGDIVVVNDPYAGGAHLPDLTFIAPLRWDGRTIAFAACRAHHADIGGKEPGSVAGDAREIYQEGLRIPPVRLWRGGEADEDLLRLILCNVRTPDERLGDLHAQRAACMTGIRRLQSLADRHGLPEVTAGMEQILDYAERRMRHALAELPDGVARFRDRLDDDGTGGGAVPIAVEVELRGDAMRLDFAGSADQVAGPINAVAAVTHSACYYAVRAFADPTAPANDGCYRPLEIRLPKRSVVNAAPPAAVVGGNLETAQRVADCVLGALFELVPDRAVAASQGTMNNVAIGGIDPRTGGAYTLYETIGGGMGACGDADGEDGIHSHMTNTMNTPIEALETAYPLRVERYELIAGSGGAGRYRGGHGIRRDLRVLGHAARVSLLADRRRHGPFGVHGGGPGRPGADLLLDADGESSRLPSKGSVNVAPGGILSIRTPGGGGYGAPAAVPPEDIPNARAPSGRSRG
jgi:N-methylhydantoinase B